jgi:hypothetical protein
MAQNQWGAKCACGSGLDGIAVLVYVDNDLRSLGNSIDCVNDLKDVIGFLLRELVFVNMSSAFNISSAMGSRIESTRLTMWLSRCE